MLALVVEADPDYAGIIAEAARFGGHQVAVVGTEDGARRLFMRERPSLVLMDVPEAGGLTLLEEFRHELPTVPIVIISASDGLLDMVRCLEAGADDYVTKPFHPSELRARLRAVCRRSMANAIAPPPTGMDRDRAATDPDADRAESIGPPGEDAWDALVSQSDELARRGTSQTHAGLLLART